MPAGARYASRRAPTKLARMDTARLLPDIEPLVRNLIRGLPLAVLVLLGAAAVRFILSRGLSLLADRTHLTREDLLPLKKALHAVVYLVAAILVLTVFGVNLGGLWAILSTILAMIAIGFVAVWSLLSNMSSTVIILLFRPFSVGDELEFTGEPVRGRVVNLNFLYTTLRRDDGALLQIPNNLFFQKTVVRRLARSRVTLAQQLSREESAALDDEEDNLPGAATRGGLDREPAGAHASAASAAREPANVPAPLAPLARVPQPVAVTAPARQASA